MSIRLELGRTRDFPQGDPPYVPFCFSVPTAPVKA